MISSKKLSQKLMKSFLKMGYSQEDMQPINVQVSMYSVDWIICNRENFIEFCRVLTACKNKKILQNEFIDSLIDGFWSETQEYVIKNYFAPWLCYLICTFYLFSTVAFDGIDNENDDLQDKIFKYSLLALTLPLYCYQIYVELHQSSLCCALKFYFSDGWNLINSAHLASACYIYVTIFAKNDELLDHWSTGAIRSISLLLLWSNSFDWLRLFDRTSFLIKLVLKTFEDIIGFLILLIIALAMFGSAMFALQYSQGAVNEHQIIEPVFNLFFVDMIYNQYMLALGEFQTDGFEEHPNRNLSFLLFISATFFT